VDLMSLIPNCDHTLDKNVLRNRLSQSKTMVYVIPKCIDTRSKKILAVASVVMLFL
jgi:hypothetical protein